MTSLLRRVVLALECDDRAQARAEMSLGPTACCAGLGAVIAHVASTFMSDRRQLSAWLDEHLETPA